MKIARKKTNKISKKKKKRNSERGGREDILNQDPVAACVIGCIMATACHLIRNQRGKRVIRGGEEK